ncbi:lipid-binding SYLF domain-containing protein [Nitrosophilus labii]|uniref:lipid-binding SYLF domain-containing protein n=1 Tax=Nitrosophilus labii TaxID=2706014 RepID=UPI001656C57E|nr:lipid-binding SYLF domain-containing protein [Nitrosophilus labii]
MKRYIFMLFALFTISLFASSEREEIMESINVLDRFMVIPEEGVSRELFSDAEAIAIIPKVLKAGFIIGGRYGKGVLLIKDSMGRWSDPLFIELKGGSLGWQIGAQSIDIILVFKTKESINELLEKKITLGADASIAAGPVGRSAAAATDAKLQSEIYSYSRSKGFFIGLSLAGSVIELDKKTIESFYKIPFSRVKDIVYQKVKSGDPLVEELKNRLYDYSR